MGQDMLSRLMEGWMGISMSRFWRKIFSPVWSTMVKLLLTLFFNRIMIQSIPAKRPRNGLQTTILRFFHGQHSLQILIQLSKEAWRVQSATRRDDRALGEDTRSLGQDRAFSVSGID